MKFLLCALMALGLMSATFVACGENGNNSASNSTDASQTAPDSSDTGSVDGSDTSSATQKSNAIGEITYEDNTYCGMPIPNVVATATYGEVTFAFAQADGETAKEDLNYLSKEEILAQNPDFKLTEGTYYVRATVEETEEYEGAVKYASITLSHKNYDEIFTEPTTVVAPTKTEQGYSVKHCTCGAEVEGEYTVLVELMLDGKKYGDFDVFVGKPLNAELPCREGYTLKLFTENGEEFDRLNTTFSQYTVLNLTSRWVVTETGYDYRADVENKIATLPEVVDESNVESVLQTIAFIEATVEMHYTDTEKKSANLALVAEKKAAANVVANSVSYQLAKRLAAIPEMEDMTDKSATLCAVLSYVQYVNSLSEAELGDYTEPRKVAIYKSYFSGMQTLVDGLNGAVETSGYKNPETGDVILDGAENNEYTISFPKIPYALLTGAKVIAYLGEANKTTGYTFKAYDATLVNAFSGSWFWIEVLVEDGNYYLSIYDTDSVSGAKVALPQAVVNGDENLSFTVATAGVWDWLKFRQDGGVSEDNLVGELKAFTDVKEVYTVSFTYHTRDGEQTITQHYLAGEKLVAPQVEAHTYTDKVGTHTFAGFGELADTVTGNISISAVYETEYKNYTITFLDADYNEFASKLNCHYGDKVVLPETTPEKAKEGDWKFEFIGWFDGDTQVTADTLIEKNMEIEPRFKQVYDGACYALTIEDEGAEAQVYQIPVVADLQAEALAEIAVPTKANYDFIGYINKQSGDVIDLHNLTLNADMVLAISWQAAYINKAAALPASVEEIVNEAQTYADLVAYIAHVSCDYSAAELKDYVDPANVAALKAHFAGVRKIYTFTTIDDSNISTSERFESVASKKDVWYQDNHGNCYEGFIQVTMDLSDGVATITLPKFAYGAYKEVSFGLYAFTIGENISLSVNGSNAVVLTQANQESYYTVAIANGVLTVHAMNDPASVKFAVALTAGQLRGSEALTLSVTESSWSCMQISHIHGELQDTVVAQADMAATLLAKLPQSVADITNEAQTYQDLVAYLAYVKNNPEDGYTQPEKVTALKAHFAGNKAVASGVMSSVNTNAGYEVANGLILTGASDSTYTFELPKINYNIYNRVSCITVFGQANSGYTFTAYGITFVNTSVAWNWVHIIKVGADGKSVKDTDTGADILLSEGYYLAIGNTDVGEEWYKYAKLPDAVVRGEEGLKFSVTTKEGSWDWMKIRQDGGVEADNLAGVLA